MLYGHTLTVLGHACLKTGHAAKMCRTCFVSVSVFDTWTRDMQALLDESGFIVANVVKAIFQSKNCLILNIVQSFVNPNLKTLDCFGLSRSYLLWSLSFFIFLIAYCALTIQVCAFYLCPLDYLQNHFSFIALCIFQWCLA